MTVHLELEELMGLIAEADYNGKITNTVTYISTKVIFPAGNEFQMDAIKFTGILGYSVTCIIVIKTRHP